MIIVNETSPRWLREFDRFARIKNMLFVWGNVHDLVSFPILLEDRQPGALDGERLAWGNPAVPH